MIFFGHYYYHPKHELDCPRSRGTIHVTARYQVFEWQAADPVYGATSEQGRSVAAALLRSDRFRVRVLTRNQDSTESRNLELLGAEIAIVPAGLGYFRALVTAFTGAEGVYSMTPQLGPRDNVEFALGEELADAAVAAGVSHIVFSTLENAGKITNGKSTFRASPRRRLLPIISGACRFRTRS